MLRIGAGLRGLVGESRACKGRVMVRRLRLCYRLLGGPDVRNFLLVVR